MIDEEDWLELKQTQVDSDKIILSLKQVIINLVKDYEKYCGENATQSAAYRTAKGIST